MKTHEDAARELAEIAADKLMREMVATGCPLGTGQMRDLIVLHIPLARLLAVASAAENVAEREGAGALNDEAWAVLNAALLALGHAMPMISLTDDCT